MKRIEFMRELEELLCDISSTEREEALQYYNDYFDDAGEENEDDVVASLGSPEKVAENIRRDIRGEEQSLGKKASATDHALVEYGTMIEEGTEQSDDEIRNQNHSNTTDIAKNTGKNGMPGWAIVLLTILAVLSFPVWFPFGIAVVATLFAILITWFALIFGFAMAAIGLFIALISLIITGFTCLLVSPWVGIALIGAGLICGSIGILFMMLTVAMAGIVTPAMFRALGRLRRGGREK